MNDDRQRYPLLLNENQTRNALQKVGVVWANKCHQPLRLDFIVGQAIDDISTGQLPRDRRQPVAKRFPVALSLEIFDYTDGSRQVSRP